MTMLLEHFSIQLAGACSDCHPHELGIGMFKKLLNERLEFMRDGTKAGKESVKDFERRANRAIVHMNANYKGFLYKLSRCLPERMKILLQQQGEHIKH